MPKIKYVGRKAGPIGETAFSHDTNITWFPGTVKNVPQAIAARMLNHPDVFALADPDQDEDDGDASTPAPQPEPVAQVQQQEQDEDDDANLTPGQRRMAAFAAGDTGNENELALGAGDQVVAAAGTGVAGAADPATGNIAAATDAAAMTLAPGGTVAAPAPAPAPAAAHRPHPRPPRRSGAKAWHGLRARCSRRPGTR
jgi:hypothetical protein